MKFITMKGFKKNCASYFLCKFDLYSKTMKRFLFLLVMLSSCGGSLTDDQRKKVKEDMELYSLKKVSDAEITETAFVLGRSFAEAIEKSASDNSKVIDSLQQNFHVKIIPLQSGDSMLMEIEKQIVEAYITGSGQVQLNDNVQRLGADSILYTKPILKEMPDKSVQFLYALGIRIPKKQIILSIKD